MVSNKSREPGLRDSYILFVIFDFWLVIMTRPYSFIPHLLGFFLLYVDDMIIIGNDIARTTYLKSQLHHHFAMKDWVLLDISLALRLLVHQRVIFFFSPSMPLIDIIKKAQLSDIRIVDTPLELDVRYSSSDGVPLYDPTLYRTLVGNLILLSHVLILLMLCMWLVSLFLLHNCSLE